MRKKQSKSYDHLESLALSRNSEISRLSLIIQNLMQRLESLEKTQTEVLDEINSLKKANSRSYRSLKTGTASKYACTMCDAKFSKPGMLQKHRKEVHKAAYNI